MANLFAIYDGKKTAKGIAIEPMTNVQKKLWYDFFEGQTPDVDGVSMKDFGTGFESFIHRFIAKMHE